jgi:hypothetical protein
MIVSTTDDSANAWHFRCQAVVTLTSILIAVDALRHDSALVSRHIALLLALCVDASASTPAAAPALAAPVNTSSTPSSTPRASLPVLLCVSRSRQLRAACARALCECERAYTVRCGAVLRCDHLQCACAITPCTTGSTVLTSHRDGVALARRAHARRVGLRRAPGNAAA